MAESSKASPFDTRLETFKLKALWQISRFISLWVLLTSVIRMISEVLVQESFRTKQNAFVYGRINLIFESSQVVIKINFDLVA